MIRKHWVAMLLALVVGASVAIPQTIAEYRMEAAYQGVHPIVSDDELYYLARAHETLDGHPTLGNPYLAEHKSEIGVQFWLPDTILTNIGVAVTRSLRGSTLIWDFVLPALAVLLTYAVLFFLIEHVLLSVGISALLNLYLFFTQLNRTPLPQLFVLLLLAFYVLLKAVETHERKWVLSATVCGGVLFYVYPFYWTYWIVVVGLLCGASVLFFWKTDAYKTPLFITLGALFMGIPYFIQTYVASKLPHYAESLMHISVIETHYPSGLVDTAYALLVTGILLVAWYMRVVPRTHTTVAVAAMALAGAVALNQQIITGVEDLPTLHYGMAVVYTSTFGLLYASVYFAQRFLTLHAKTAASVAGICLIVISLAGVAPKVIATATPSNESIQAQRYGPIFDWLNSNTKTDEVVYANEVLSPYIPAYTHNNVFFSNWVFLSYISQSEIEKRFLGSRYFDLPLSREEILEAESELFGSYYMARFQHSQTINKLHKIFGLKPVSVERYPEVVVEKLKARAKDLEKGSFENALSGLKANFVVWDSIKDSHWRLPKNFTKMFEANGLIVYAI